MDGEDGEDLLGEEDAEDRDPNGDIAGVTDSRAANISLEASLDRRKPFRSENDAVRQPTSDASTFFPRPQVPTDPYKDVGATTSSEIDPNLSQTEKLLSHNRIEQEDLTASLLSMAQALKASSRAFASSLESEKEILDRASEGLEKNTAGMEAAEKRMGALRRMTEGKGWLGRMLMYAWIMGLMMIALIIVGFLPKLRF